MTVSCKVTQFSYSERERERVVQEGVVVTLHHCVSWRRRRRRRRRSAYRNRRTQWHLETCNMYI